MKKLLAVVVILALCGVGSFAADNDNHDVVLVISAIAALDVEGADPLTLTIDDTAINPGDAPASDTDNTVRLQYTMIQATSVGTIDVTSTGTVPAGTSLSITVTPPAVGGVVSGDPGDVGTTAVLTGTDDSSADIVTGIGSCKTGSAAGEGAVVLYTFAVTNFTSLAPNGAGATVNIVYTISP
jgi:hypothetical protein